ncbi:hypothetical protein BAUCODRAFT_435814 [Baudoinia panamericana UAMH 10762]|uniref:Uncharacterized protein n=1 Tax=Baudoinia panamericana (strain UAMH 10762) TaxID=717646 RepID=M2LRG1_BAUPA|nr:uncharacterized protein BAUCODRAFT_435814 [Baudoinia panamericana UAMH 10762]EMC97022.1 hypothetical protein BAUCODRAFT_435814 [Baudoinia panamericana UAMH 10762]
MDYVVTTNFGNHAVSRCNASERLISQGNSCIDPGPPLHTDTPIPPYLQCSPAWRHLANTQGKLLRINDIPRSSLATNGSCQSHPFLGLPELRIEPNLRAIAIAIYGALVHHQRQCSVVGYRIWYSRDRACKPAGP